MKINPVMPLVAATVLAFSIAVQAQSTPLVFKAQNAIEEGSRIFLPNDANTCQFVISDKKGVSLGEKPTAGSDGKSLVFSGRQMEAFVLSDSLPLAKTGFDIEISFLLNSDAASTDQSTTLMKHRNWEIGWQPSKNTLALVVWHPSEEKPYSIVRVPVQGDSWQRLKASLVDNVLSLDVNGQTNQVDLSDSLSSDVPTARLIMGAASPSGANIPAKNFRPFAGSLADVSISLE
jgi:hypothetical protein